LICRFTVAGNYIHSGLHADGILDDAEFAGSGIDGSADGRAFAPVGILPEKSYADFRVGGDKGSLQWFSWNSVVILHSRVRAPRRSCECRSLLLRARINRSRINVGGAAIFSVDEVKNNRNCATEDSGCGQHVA
jgi:hypothetical protein